VEKSGFTFAESSYKNEILMNGRSIFTPRNLIGFILIVLFSFEKAAHAADPWPDDKSVFPDKHWAKKNPKDVGMDDKKLDAFRKATEAKEGCIIRHGHLVYQWGEISTVRRFASAYKPVNSTMLLFALKEGLIDSVDDQIRPWVQKVFSDKDLVEKDRTMTFRHLCNMTSGYALPENPGDAWGYNDRGIALKRMLLYGFDKSGNGHYGVFNEGSEEAQRNPNRLGALQFEDNPDFKGGSGELSVRDFARIGWFWHNKGNWKGLQLLPRSYFDDYMKSQVPTKLPRTQGGENEYLGVWPEGGGTNQTPHGPGAYGFNWWFNPDHRLLKDVPSDIIHANGNWNKRALTIFPSLDMVVVWNEGPWGQDGEGLDVIPDLNNMLKLLVEAVVDAGTKKKRLHP
jgi:hypothetical protein